MLLANVCLVLIVIVVTGLAGYLGWSVSAKQFSQGYSDGYKQGAHDTIKAVDEALKASTPPTKPNLRPIK